MRSNESRERVGVDPEDLQRVAAAALSRAGYELDDARGGPVGNVATFRLNPADPAFAKDAGWDDAFDDLRVRPRKRGERLGDWRRDAPIRSIAFRPPILGDGRDATDVVQVHLEHRLVRRLLSRFLSQGFQSKLSRISVRGAPISRDADWLPAIEQFGEGIFIHFGDAAVSKWLHEDLRHRATKDFSQVMRTGKSDS